MANGEATRALVIRNGIATAVGLPKVIKDLAGAVVLMVIEDRKRRGPTRQRHHPRHTQRLLTGAGAVAGAIRMAAALEAAASLPAVAMKHAVVVETRRTAINEE